MLAEFLPSSVTEIKDVEAIALLQRIHRRAVDVPFEQGTRAIASFTQSGGYNSLGDRIIQVTHPTLILWGEADDVLGRVDATRFEQAISNSQLVWIEGAGHVPHFEQPQVVASHLLAFAQQARV